MDSSNHPTRRRAMVNPCQITAISSNRAAIHLPNNNPINRYRNNRISRCRNSSHGQSVNRNNLLSRNHLRNSRHSL